MKIGYYTLKSTIDRELFSKLENDFKEFFPFLENIESFKTVNRYEIIIFLICSGGVEEEVINHISEIKAKDMIFICEGMNNSLAAGLEIISCLRENISYKRGLYYSSEENFKIIEKYINFKKNCYGKNIGILGGISNWLIGSNFSKKIIKDKLNINFKDIPMKSILDNSRFISKINNELEKAEKFSEVIDEICKKENLHFITLKCFDIIKPLNTTGCLALSKKNDEMVTASCEGDIPALISMIIASSYSNSPVFMANPSSIDFEKNEITMAHCTIPLKLTLSHKLTTHFETGIGIGIDGNLKDQYFFMFKIDGFLKQHNLFTGAKIKKDHKNNLCRTQLSLKIEESLEKLLETPIGNHLILFPREKNDNKFEKYIDLIIQ